MITEEIRSYEVSIWTLQDEFITVLKWSDAEKKGRIENPKMVLNIDGTQTFDFSIPMYYQYQGKLIDNPSWYNTLNGNLIEGMRKIKVIFNKGTNDEEVFEFLIVKMTDNHEKDVASCDIKCEGLAFHELGKQGYKISLSLENFEVKYKKWAESDKTEPEPLQTIDYWCGDKTTCNLQIRPENESQIDPNTWYYTVCMNQKSFKDSTGANARVSTKIYEEPYPTNWDPATLIPESYEEYREKARTVTADKSNLYNLTQSIAEAFQVHCTYKYTYDVNYHITSRTIVFYNSFFQEENGAMSFTYPYSSSKITRDSDCTNLTTKLYVLTTDNDKTVAGYNSIMNASTNPSHEDYILNFDYMLDRGIISQDQYDAIKPYEIAMKNCNEQLIKLQQNLATYNVQKPEIEAKVTIYERSIALDNENIAQNQALKNALDIKDGEADGSITIDENNPDTRVVLENTNGVKYINLQTTNKGIKTDTVKVYRSYNNSTHVLSDEVSNFTFEYDEYGRPSKIFGVTPVVNSNSVYLTYKYDPKLYYDAVVQVWETKLGNDEASLAEQQALLGPEEYTSEYYDVRTTAALIALEVAQSASLDTCTIEIDYYKRPHLFDINTHQFMSYYSLSSGNESFEVLVSPILPDGTMLSEITARNLARAYANGQITKNTVIDNTNYHFSDIFMGRYTSIAAADRAAEAYHNYHERLMLADGGIRKLIKDTQIYIDAILEAKNARIKEFERLMGAALREGYWQPEDYKDYGINKEDTDQLQIQNMLVDTEESFIAGWDEELFDEENKNYYEESVNLNPIYYPCIDLYTLYQNSTFRNNLMNYSFIFNNNYNETIDNQADIRFTQVFSIGSGALLEFGKITVNGEEGIHPLLVLVGAKSMSNGSNGSIDEISFMKRDTDGDIKGGNPRLAIITEHSNGTYAFSGDPIPVSEYFVDGINYTTVYPRIKFSSLNLRADSSDLVIRYENDLLEVAKDYIVQTRNTLRDEQYYSEYFITIKPEVLYRNKTYTGDFNIHYILSNADNQIYLDALEVSKENAYPKVEYTVAPNILNRNLSKTLYQKLATLVMINDVQLKLENVFGYISKVELDLDNVSKDQVEVKNYTSKFEDLFSTIVAQTEQMKQDSAQFHAAMEGQVPLTERTLEHTLSQNELTMMAYLDSYFDSSEVVRAKLESLFTEAGEILGDSNKALNKMRALTLDNAAILQGFATNISQELTTQVYRQNNKPTSYKPGDIWIDNDGNRYVATAYSSEGYAGGTSGFVRTYDGTLASMTGAALDINADDGEIKVTAANNLYLASNQVDIVGNDIVNIGGAKINIVSLTKDNISYNPGGINLIAGSYRSDGNYGTTSRVLISPTLVEMGAATLRFKAASTIDMIASLGTEANTSTITLNPDTGIWIGSGKSVSLFAGSNNTGANVQLTPTHIIMGVSSGSDTSAFELQKDFLIMAVGTTSSDFSSSNVTINSTGSLTGMKLTKDSFGLAIANNSTRTVILANSDGITLGTGDTPVTSGSYVQISGGGIDIGSLGTLYVNMTNFKLQTDILPGDSTATTRFAIGKNLDNIDANNLNGISNDSTNNPFVGLVYNKYGLFVNGTIYASAGSFTGNITATSFTLSGQTAIDDFDNAVSGSMSSVISGIGTAIDNTTQSTVFLYYLSASQTAPSAPNAEVTTASTTALNTWALSYPQYPVDNTTTYYYYSCIQTKTEGGNVTWSTPVREYGVTSAAQAASIAKITRDAFNTNGLISNYSWGGVIWPVALTSTSNLLIGANGDTMSGGIFIAKSAAYSDGAAVVINKDGIAMTGSTISLNADSTISITSGANINISSANFTIQSNPVTGASFFRLGPSSGDPLMEYNQDGTLSIKANIIELQSGTSLIKLTTDSLYLNGEAKVVMTSQNELILSGTDGVIQYAKHKLFISDTMYNDCVSIIEQGIIVEDYIYLTANYTDTTQSETFSKGVWQLIKDNTTDAGIRWDPIILYSSYNSESAWTAAYASFIAENFSADSFSLQIDRTGTIRCQHIECYGDIYCHGSIYCDDSTIHPIPEQGGIDVGTVSGNSLIGNPIIFTI